MICSLVSWVQDKDRRLGSLHLLGEACSCFYCSRTGTLSSPPTTQQQSFQGACSSTHLSLSRELCLELLSARPLGNTLWGCSTTTWGFSRKHHPLWTPTWSLLSWITTVLSAPSGPGCFWELLEQLLTNQAKIIKKNNYNVGILQIIILTISPRCICQNFFLFVFMKKKMSPQKPWKYWL